MVKERRKNKMEMLRGMTSVTTYVSSELFEFIEKGVSAFVISKRELYNLALWYAYDNLNDFLVFALNNKQKAKQEHLKHEACISSYLGMDLLAFFDKCTVSLELPKSYTFNLSLSYACSNWTDFLKYTQNTRLTKKYNKLEPIIVADDFSVVNADE